jgi:Flp pilus assembly CpaF family ATPase
MSVVPIHEHDIPDEAIILGLSQKTAKEINEGWRKALGPAVALLTDPDVTDVRKNPQSSALWVVRQATGKQVSTFKQTTAEAERMCAWIARAYGRDFTWTNPVLEAILPWHGGRFSARRSPLVRGIQWSMRLHAPEVIPLDDFALAGVASVEQVKFLRRLIDDEVNILIGGEQGAGKALDVETPLLTPNGWVRMGDVTVGDEVMGRSGKPTRVVGVYPQGELPAYRVTFTDGTSTVCCDDHLWTVRTHNDRVRDRGWRVLPLREIRADLLTGQGYAKYAVPLVEPLDFPERLLPLDPYLLGVLIGDGTLYKATPRFTTADDEIRDSVASLLPTGTESVAVTTIDYRIRSTESRYEARAPGVRGASRVKNAVAQALHVLGLAGLHSYEKFVPPLYLFATRRDREALLQGLLDTDGSIVAPPRGMNIEFSTTSQRLADDVVFLVQSLGGIARQASRVTRYSYRGVSREGRLSFRITIQLPNEIRPFRLGRKADRVRPRTEYHPTRKIVSIEPVGKREMQCIAVDAADSLYVVNDCIVTHNTTLLNSLLAEITKRRKSERIAIIEDTHEIMCDGDDYYKVLADPNVGWDYPQIIKSEMRHGASKMILGEIRNGASSVLEAYTTGSRGNLATIHGGSKEDVLSRFEILLRRDGFPVERPAIAQAIGGIAIMRRRGVGRVLREVYRLTGATDKGYSFSER